MRPGHPAEAAGEGVLQAVQERGGALHVPTPLSTGVARQVLSHPGHLLVEAVRLHDEEPLVVPARSARALELRRDLVPENRAVPRPFRHGEERGMQQPETFRSIDRERRVVVRYAEGVGDDERVTPGSAPMGEPRTGDSHVVALVLVAAAEERLRAWRAVLVPDGEQLSAGGLDHAGCVHVPAILCEEEPLMVQGAGGPSASGDGQEDSERERRPEAGRSYSGAGTPCVMSHPGLPDPQQVGDTGGLEPAGQPLFEAGDLPPALGSDGQRQGSCINAADAQGQTNPPRYRQDRELQY